MKKEDLFTLRDVAKRFDLPPHRITYLYITRKLEEPRLRLGNRRIFTEGDIKRLSVGLKLLTKPAGKEIDG